MEDKKLFPSELALVLGLIANSFGVALMVKSGFGISSISSVPYTLNLVIEGITFGVLNYIFQCTLIVILVLITRKFMVGYILSFGLAIIFGYLLDFFSIFIAALPEGMIYYIIYFMVSFSILAIGICLLLKCKLPILPIDTFTRDITSHFNIPYKKVKTVFDLLCLTTTLILSLVLLHRIEGVGIGTVICALTTGKAVSIVSDWIDKRYYFAPTIKKLEQIS